MFLQCKCIYIARKLGTTAKPCYVNNIPPLNNKTENSKGNNNKHHSKKKCQIAIKYFQDKNLSPAEVTKALEDEKFTAIEIQTVMNGISFKKA